MNKKRVEETHKYSNGTKSSYFFDLNITDTSQLFNHMDVRKLTALAI